MAIRLVVGSSIRKGRSEVIGLGHAGNDLAAVVRHDEGRLGCLWSIFAVDGGSGEIE